MVLSDKTLTKARDETSKLNLFEGKIANNDCNEDMHVDNRYFIVSALLKHCDNQISNLSETEDDRMKKYVGLISGLKGNPEVLLCVTNINKI